MRTVEHRVPNGAGWLLSLYQTRDERRFVRGRRPILIVPGYGMNSRGFSYHPRGPSLEGFLAHEGFEVWRADLRAQGRSKPTSGKGRDAYYQLEDLALVDLPAVVEEVVARTETGASRVDLIGASLGGTIMFIYVAFERAHRAGSLVAIGTPVRWTKVHPIMKLAFGWPGLVGRVRLRGTRALAASALPRLVRRTPWVLSAYLNPRITDTSAAEELCKTIEDPSRHVNRQIAEWIRDKDLIVRGQNLSDAIRNVTRPLLCVLATADGIVPRPTAEFVYRQVGSKTKALLVVGSDELAIAHADMFVSDAAHDRVFRPVADWLAMQPDARNDDVRGARRA